MNVDILVTLRCNLSCSLCNMQGAMSRFETIPDPSFETIVHWLDELAGMQPNIDLNGGEPFVRKDIPAIVGEVKRRGMTCGVFTNGSLVDESTVEKLYRQKTDFVVIAVHGGRETHNRICGSGKAFSAVRKTLDLFDQSERGTKITLNCVLSSENLDDLQSVIDLGDEYGVDSICFSHPSFFTPRDTALFRTNMEGIFAGEDVCYQNWEYDIRDEADRFRKCARRLIEVEHPKVTFSPHLDEAGIDNWYSLEYMLPDRCRLFPWRATYIYPNGDVVPCDLIGRVMGNLNKQKFEEIWNGKRYREFRRRVSRELPSGCIRCCQR